MTEPLRTTAPRSPGFTLVELLVVIAIIGVLAARDRSGFGNAFRPVHDAVVGTLFPPAPIDRRLESRGQAQGLGHFCLRDVVLVSGNRDGREHPDDGDHDQEFDECETGIP